MTEPFRADRVTRCSIHRDGATVRLAGDIDVGNWVDIGGRVAAEVGTGCRYLDLTAMRYFGAAGVRVVLKAHGARPAGVTLQVVCAPSVFRVMRISGLLVTEGLVVTEAAMERQSPVGAAMEPRSSAEAGE